MTNRKLSTGVFALACSLAFTPLALAQSGPSPDAPPPPFAAPDMRAVGPTRPNAEMQHVLDTLGSLGGKPIETLTPAQARRQPTPTDAVKAIMRERGIAMDTAVTTEERSYGDNPWQKVRIYHPAGHAGMNHAAGGMPLVVYYHGGGWVIADLDTYDGAPRAMAKALNAIVISVEYRHAPEFKFPSQHEDAALAYRWVLSQAPAMGVDPRRIAFAGESAGGNLAVATAIYARDNRLTMPRAIVSVYPIADTRNVLPSRIDSAAAKPLNTPMLGWFGNYYMRSMADAQDPRLNLVRADLRRLPPVTIINASIDPLRSDGDNLAVALRRAGNSVVQRTYPGVTHEFFGMAPVVKTAAQAQMFAVQRLRPALAPRR